MKKRWIGAAAALLLASGCAQEQPKEEPQVPAAQESGEAHDAHAGHDAGMHDQSGALPAGVTPAEKPLHAAGTEVTVQAEHMPGMNGAQGTVVGAYDTHVYAVTYQPITGGEVVKGHKWVIQEEWKDKEEPLTVGETGVLQALHMPGMEGAEATVDSVEKTTVYMIDYTPTTGGEMVKNHQWVTEAELQAAPAHH